MCTVVRIGASSAARITGYIAKGTAVRGYLRCVNDVGHVWYEITGNELDEDPRFVFSGNL
ncbi:hypothetical protein DY218_12615 [Streptomyces triticagri]|uniref:SH3 domain-containing protein n=1 Tax=Streptomyces triticagri TaxID=2293568 RepID=A0A372M6D5_9ACTN|nr:hypothetical protein [Streptomyces triticagri]RFU86401.1 hypothetical protein DY218_12615 [Streptomyces triticagri]